MSIILAPKRPEDIVRYRHDWTDYLGEDIIASQTTDSDDVNVVSQAIDADTAVVFELSGGADGTNAVVTQTIVTSAGEQKTETFVQPVSVPDEPVNLTEAKRQANVDSDADDAQILSYIRAARAFVESESGYIFVRRQVVEPFDGWTRFLRLGHRPIVSIDGIDYTDRDGVQTTLDPTGYFSKLDMGRIYPVRSWPATDALVSVRYTAGFDVGEITPEVELARQAILLLVGHWYNQREAVTVGNFKPEEVPFAVRALIDKFRVPVA